MEESMITARAECTFIIKEGGRHPLYIQIEPGVTGLDIAFTLKEGTTLEVAQDLARRMCQMMVSISLSAPPEPYDANIVEAPPTKQ
jgi:hypothetical protein